MHIVSCSFEIHAEAILAILNEAIVTSTALYDYVPRPAASMRSWFRAKEDGAFPVIGMEDAAGALLGFASYGVFRPYPANKYSVEHSVYVHPAHRGRGIARVLMQRLIERAREQGYHVLVGGIDARNATSVALHERLGFRHAGTIEQAAFKFGAWCDLAFYQLILDTPAHPMED